MAHGSATAIAKWGNSAGIRISKAVAEQAELHEGDQVKVEVEAPGVIVVRAVTERPSLTTLLSRITTKNRHAQVTWGAPRGKEIW